MQCATQAREVSQPTSSNCSTGRRPKRSRQYVSSSGSSARCVCSRTSSLSASSAVRRIRARRDGERRAGRERHPDHGAEGRVVVQLHQALAVGEHLVVVLHDRVGRQPAVLLRQGHGPARAVEPQADLARGGDLRGPQVAAAARRDVQVVRRRGAPAERELGEAHPRGQVRGLLVDPGPQRVQRGEPGEQRPVDRRPVGPGEVLVDVMVSVDQPGRHQAPGGVKHLSRLRLGIPGRPHRGDHPAGDGDPPPGELPPGGVAGRHQLRVPHQQVSGLSRHQRPQGKNRGQNRSSERVRGPRSPRTIDRHARPAPQRLARKAQIAARKARDGRGTASLR